MLLVVGSASKASRQLLYTVSWLVVTLLLPVLLASARFCRRAVWGLREAGCKHE